MCFAAGGDCMPDIESLRKDGGVPKMLGYTAPSPRCVADFLEAFHDPEKVAQARAQAQRQEHLSFIPEETAALWGLGQAGRGIVRAIAGRSKRPQTRATVDQDFGGHLTAKTHGTDTTIYEYSSRGELLSVTLPDSTTVEYVYDALGRRVAKKINGTVDKKYLWPGATTLLAEFNASNGLIARFECADGRMPVAMVTGGGTKYYFESWRAYKRVDRVP